MEKKARNNIKAARVLTKNSFYDSSVSRAYYAVYLAAWHYLKAMNINPPQKAPKGGYYWPHHKLPEILCDEYGFIGPEHMEIIRLIENATNYDYPLRWVDEETSLGDFDGREVAIDVFNIHVAEQIDFLTLIRQVRDKIREMIGHRGVFIFHSPEATRMHYANLFPMTRGVLLEAGSSLRF